MMMAEAIATSASKRTLCLRRSILRMRFIAAPSRSGSAVPVAPSSSGASRSCYHGRHTRRWPGQCVVPRLALLEWSWSQPRNHRDIDRNAGRLLWGSPISTPTTSRRPPLQAVHKSHHAHHGTRVSHVVGAAKTVIGAPVHPFRPVRKWFEHALAPSQLHPDLLRPSKTALAHGFLLGFIGQAAAVPTREQFSSTVKNRNSTPTRTDKPGTSSAEVAGRPGDRHPPLD